MAICIVCNDEFNSIRGNHKCCSPDCKKVKSKLDKRAMRSQWSKQERDEVNRKQRERRQKKDYLSIKCKKCNDPFKPKTKLNIYCSTRCSDFINKKLRNNLRSRLNKAIKGDYRDGSAVNDLGCSIYEFKKYLETQFQEGMSWDNWSRSGWHIDHKIALAKFDLTNKEELRKAVHYTNLQPMWAKDNYHKGSKYE